MRDTMDWPSPAQPGTWLKCALHAHSTSSDGELPPEKLARHYEWAGFDVLAVTDHWLRTVPRYEGPLLLLPSTELNARVSGSEADVHVLGLGIGADPEPPAERYAGLAETAAWIRGQGGVAFLAHSYWSGVRASDFEDCEELAGLEIFNAGCELEAGSGVATVHWDEALARGRRLFGIATDDTHHPGYDSALAWVWARCTERTAEAVVEALRAGRFYSSTGPEIRALALEDGAVEVHTSAARSVTLLGGPTRGASVHAGRLGYRYGARVLEASDGGEITAARLERPRGARFGRLEVRDGRGGVAWTNPLWVS
jgi:hypothetical protein